MRAKKEERRKEEEEEERWRRRVTVEVDGLGSAPIQCYLKGESEKNDLIC